MAILAAFFNIALNLLLIPITEQNYANGGIGAATATVLTEGLMMAGAFYLMPKGILEIKNLVTFIKAALVSTAMVVWLSLFTSLNLLWTIFGGGVFYLTIAMIIRTIPKEDIAHIRHALLKR